MEVGVVGFGELVELSWRGIVSDLTGRVGEAHAHTSLHQTVKHLSVHPASRSGWAWRD